MIAHASGDAGEGKHLFIAGVNANVYNRYKSNCGSSPKKLEINLAQDSVIPLLGTYPKDSTHSVMCRYTDVNLCSLLLQ